MGILSLLTPKNIIYGAIGVAVLGAAIWIFSTYNSLNRDLLEVTNNYNQLNIKYLELERYYAISEEENKALYDTISRNDEIYSGALEALRTSFESERRNLNSQLTRCQDKVGLVMESLQVPADTTVVLDDTSSDQFKLRLNTFVDEYNRMFTTE